jgi:hypothetical protein
MVLTLVADMAFIMLSSMYRVAMMSLARSSSLLLLLLVVEVAASLAGEGPCRRGAKGSCSKGCGCWDSTARAVASSRLTSMGRRHACAHGRLLSAWLQRLAETAGGLVSAYRPGPRPFCT